MVNGDLCVRNTYRVYILWQLQAFSCFVILFLFHLFRRRFHFDIDYNSIFIGKSIKRLIDIEIKLPTFRSVVQFNSHTHYRSLSILFIFLFVLILPIYIAS